MTKFCTAFHEILAFKQNRARKQEVGPNSAADFFILIILKIKVQLVLYPNIQPNISSGSGGKVDFNGLAIFSKSGQFFSPTSLNFIILKPCSLVMLNVKFEDHGCCGFRE